MEESLMNKNLRYLSVLASLLLLAALLTSCVTYGYTLVTHNETTAKLRDHDILGSVLLDVSATSKMFNEERGVRALLLMKARSLYGEDIDDVVNIAVSQTSDWQSRHFIVKGDAIRYKENL